MYLWSFLPLIISLGTLCWPVCLMVSVPVATETSVLKWNQQREVCLFVYFPISSPANQRNMSINSIIVSHFKQDLSKFMLCVHALYIVVFFSLCCNVRMKLETICIKLKDQLMILKDTEAHLSSWKNSCSFWTFILQNLYLFYRLQICSSHINCGWGSWKSASEISCCSSR